MTYKVLSNLKASGKTYSIGDKIEMDEDKAIALVSDGTLEQVEIVKPIEIVEKKKKSKRK